MPASDLEAFKVNTNEFSSTTKFNNLVQAVEVEFSDVDADQIPGFPGSQAKYFAGDGSWPDLGAVQTYTPSWAASGSAPSIGNGVIVGRYIKIGKFVWTYGSLTMGSTTTFGTGFYTISLPVTASSSFEVNQCGLMALQTDTGTTSHASWAYLQSTTAINMWSIIQSTGTSQIVAQTQPFTWANTDVMRWAIMYEAAS